MPLTLAEPGATTMDRDLALYDLIRHVAYADGQWIRHMPAFEIALRTMGMRWDWRLGLFQGDIRIPNPYDEPE